MPADELVDEFDQKEAVQKFRGTRKQKAFLQDFMQHQNDDSNQFATAEKDKLGCEI